MRTRRGSKWQENRKVGRGPISCEKIVIDEGIARQFPVPYFKTLLSFCRKEAAINGLPIWHGFCACILPVIYRRGIQRGNPNGTAPVLARRALGVRDGDLDQLDHRGEDEDDDRI